MTLEHRRSGTSATRRGRGRARVPRVGALLFVLIGLVAACSSGATEGAACDAEGAGSQTADGQDVMCTADASGQLRWTRSGPGTSRGVERELWAGDAGACPDAIVDTGFEVVLIAGEATYGADQGTTETVLRECPDAVARGRTESYTLAVDGVDYVTQLERAGVAIPTLRDHFSQGECEEREVSIGRSFTDAPDSIEMLWPLGMVSYKHVIPTDHMYIQWTDMTPGANALLAPADGHVVDIEGVADDLRVVIELSCDEYIAYGHVDALAGPLERLAGDFGPDRRRMLTRIPVKAGDPVALGGEVMTDLWYWDQRRTLEGVRIANYILHNGMNVYAVDPFEYLTDPVSARIAEKIAGESAPTRGRIGWNEQGTAQGGWYQLDTWGERGPSASWLDHVSIYAKDLFGPWDGALSWAPDGLDPTTWLVAVGSFNDNGSVIGITRDNVSPRDLTPGGAPVALELYDFDYVDEQGRSFSRDDQAQRRYARTLTATPNDEKLGVLVVQLIDDTTLHVEKRPGASAPTTAAFTSAPIVYTR